MTLFKTLLVYSSALLLAAFHSSLSCMDVTKQLFKALSEEDDAQVITLTSKVADLNAYNTRGNTPLFIAIFYNSVPEVVEALLKGGAAPNLKTKKGYTSLTLAAYFCGENMDLLLKHGASPNAQNAGGFTALHYVAGTTMEGRAHTMITLLRYGARPSIKDKNNETACDLACKFKRKPEQDILTAFCLSTQERKRLIHGAKSLIVLLHTRGSIPLDIVKIIIKKDFTNVIDIKFSKFLNIASNHVRAIQNLDALRTSMAKNCSYEMKMPAIQETEESYPQEMVQAALKAYPLIGD